MTIEQIWAQWNTEMSTGERERLLSEVFAMPESLPFLLEQAGATVIALPPQALETATLAREIATARQDPHARAMAERIRGQALRALGRHKEAIDAFEAAATSAGEAKEPVLAAQVRIGAVDSLGMLGHYQEALTLAHRLEAELRAGGAEQDAAKVLFNAGSLHFRQDQYALALDCYQKAGVILEQGQNYGVVARIKTNCGNALTQLNRIDEAIALYTEAHTLFTAQGMRIEAAIVDTNVGFLHHVSGHYAQALATLTRAYHEFIQSGRQHDTARCLIDRAEAYRALNLYPEALEDYAEALQIFAQLPLDYDRARAELGSAAVFMAQNRFTEAWTALEHASSLFQRQKNTVQLAHTRLIRSYLLWSEGSMDAACAEAQRAERALKTQKLEGWAAEARFLIAQRKLDTTGEARSMQSVRRAAQQTGRGWLECRAEHALGLHYAQEGKLAPALKHLRASVAVLEAARTLIAPEEMHVAFLRNKQIFYSDLVETLLARGRQRDVAEALEYVERSKSQLLREKVLAAQEGLSTPNRIKGLPDAHLAALRADLSREYHRTQTLREEGSQRLTGSDVFDLAQLEPLELAYREALRDIELSSLDSAPAVFRYSIPITADALCATLLPHETLIEFYIANDEISAFIITPDGVRIHRNIAHLAEVAFAARRLRYHLQKMEMASEYVAPIRDQLLSGARDVLHKLYVLLLRPLEAHLTTEQVVVIPHGILHGLPFHAFFEGPGYALDRWEFVYAPSATLWQMRRPLRPQTSASPLTPERPALLMGIPAPGIERVAGEVEQLARILPNAQLFLEENATLATFREHASHCSILHLATHATFREDNPLFSGLRFTDDWLLARDLYDIALDCDLATLSACQTGITHVEPGDELFGLVRGFLAAGAGSVAASLWPADDAATANLMIEFYTQLAQGIPHAAALRTAQQCIRERYPHPYYWAAFVLIGRRATSYRATLPGEEVEEYI